eukprot:scaffold76294_cov33-Phaeocystis_antarctica.AAC.1
MGGLGGGSLEHPRRWLRAQWAGLSPGSAGPARAARRALRRRGSRPRALPGGTGRQRQTNRETHGLSRGRPQWSSGGQGGRAL